MASINRLLPLARLAIFGTASLFGFIILVMSAHILHMAGAPAPGILDFAALGVAVGLLTLLTLPAMLCIGRIRSGARASAMASFIAVELCWIGFLWIMWLATGGSTASINPTGGRCGIGAGASVCGEINAIEAFAFLNWLMLMGYFATLLVFSFKSLQAGNSSIWTTSVNDANFEGSSYPSDKNGVHHPSYAQQYPPSNVYASSPAAAQV